MADRTHQPHRTTYSVNGEEQTTDQETLTVGQILENAGFAPASDYSLTSENPPGDFDSEYERVIDIHNHQRFLAIFKGTTPVS